MNNLIRNERRAKDKNEAIKLEKDATSRDIWNTIKQKVGWIQSLSPTALNVEGNLVTGHKDIADTLNSYYINKVNTICNELRCVASDPTKTLRKLWEKWDESDMVQHFEFKPINNHTIKKYIRSLKNTHSEYRDGLSNSIIKIAAPALVIPMTHLANMCFKTNKFPNKWKLYKIIALYKNKDSREDPKIF